MDLNVWKQRIVREIELIADESYQRRNWFLSNNPGDTPGEFINRLVDDRIVELYLVEAAPVIDGSELEALTKLVAALDVFSSETLDFLDPHAVIDDPRWREIRLGAGRYLAVAQNP